jgi:hypothetical protein
MHNVRFVQNVQRASDVLCSLEATVLDGTSAHFFLHQTQDIEIGNRAADRGAFGPECDYFPRTSASHTEGISLQNHRIYTML